MHFDAGNVGQNGDEFVIAANKSRGGEEIEEGRVCSQPGRTGIIPSFPATKPSSAGRSASFTTRTPASNLTPTLTLVGN